MTDEDEPTREQIIAAVRQVLREFAPDADPQDVEEFLESIAACDPEELEVNTGQGFGQFCDGEAACNAAFDRYAVLIGALEVKSNPTRPQS